MESYYQLCRSLIHAGWTLNDIEEADFETLIQVVCGERKEEKVDLIDYMKQKQGLVIS